VTIAVASEISRVKAKLFTFENRLIFLLAQFYGIGKNKIDIESIARIFSRTDDVAAERRPGKVTRLSGWRIQ
jgi:hypothetical protein